MCLRWWGGHKSTFTLVATKEINEDAYCMYELEHVFCNEFCKLKFYSGHHCAKK